MAAVRSLCFARGFASTRHLTRHRAATAASRTTRATTTTAMSTTATPIPAYPVGTPGVAWGDAEKAAWRAHVGAPTRSYADEVLAKLEPLKAGPSTFFASQPPSSRPQTNHQHRSIQHVYSCRVESTPP